MTKTSALDANSLRRGAVARAANRARRSLAQDEATLARLRDEGAVGEEHIAAWEKRVAAMREAVAGKDAAHAALLAASRA